jgi:NAD(P)-dependent dehydrogenase (short-subunit alcohol dehydrogenase family)
LIFFADSRSFRLAQSSKDKTSKMKNLQDKVALVFAASGEIAGAVARSFADHGAKVYVSGRNLTAVKVLAEEIKADGGWAEAAKVDALNESDIDNYFQKIIGDNGKVDIVFNGIGNHYKDAGSGTPSTMVTLEQFLSPLHNFCGSQFLTSRIAAKYMIQTASRGTILLLTSSLSRMKTPNMAGFAAASAAIEALTRVLAAEFGGQGIKVTCICPSAILESHKMSEMIGDFAKIRGVAQEQHTEQVYKRFDILKTSPTLKHVGEVAVFLASDNGIALNSHIVDVDCGKLNVI